MASLDEILEIGKKASVSNTLINIKKNKIGITIKLIGRIVMGVGIFGGLILGLLLTPPASSVTASPNPLRWVYAIAIMGHLL